MLLKIEPRLFGTHRVEKTEVAAATLQFVGPSLPAGTTGVARRFSLTLTFSEALDPSTIDAISIVDRAANTAVETTAVVQNDTEVLITTESLLDAMAEYEVQIGTTLKSTSGTNLEAAVNLLYTTGEPALAGTALVGTVPSGSFNVNFDEYVVKANDNGQVIVAWKDHTSALWANYCDGLTCGTPILLNASPMEPRAAINPQGEACVSWVVSSDIFTRCYASGWGATEKQSPSTTSTSQSALISGQHSDIRLFWFQGGTDLKTRVWRNGTWSNAEMVASFTFSAFVDPLGGVAMAPDGKCVLAMRDTSTGNKVQATYGSDSGWITSQLQAADGPSTPPVVAIDDAGIPIGIRGST